MFILSVIIFILICNASSNNAVANEEGSSIARIISISTDPKANGWIYLNEGSGILTIRVKTEGVQSVKFWIRPTGTQVTERKFLGELCCNQNDWIFKWEYGADESIHSHIVIEAIGPSGFETELLNVTRGKNPSIP